MQIVIDIDEETLQDLYNSRYVSLHIKDVFKNATPLKNHGRLIDADALYYQQTHECGYYTPFELIDKVDLDNAPTILAAQYHNN